MRSLVVGTAGHIDHGKTTLVQALTGINADRLPEEKRRGITIDLGFAELELGDVRIGFVDVPGHERFVKNMLAGAHGIDAVALVIAADEGVMPQTREHLDICSLLQVPTGVVVITKTDAVDGELLELVRAEAEELVAGSFLEGASIVEVSAKSGKGLDRLKSELHELARTIPARSLEMVARLPIDRAFTMKGFGAIVTGTLVSGEIAHGDELELLPSGKRARVRGLQVHGASVEKAVAGQRTAINLGGIDSGSIERGMLLAPPDRLRPSQIVDVSIDLLKSAPRRLRSRARVRVHIGAAEILARIRVLEDGGEIAPGGSGFAQLRLESPIVAVPGERFIIRSYSPSHTIAGGGVLDGMAAKYRGRDVHLARKRLFALLNAGSTTRFSLMVESAGSYGIRFNDARARTGWSDKILKGLIRDAKDQGTIVDVEEVYVGHTSFESLMKNTLKVVSDYHAREPLARGMNRETLRESLFAHAPPEVFRAAMRELEIRQELVAEKDVVRLPSHSRTLSVDDRSKVDRLELEYRKAGLEAPSLEEAMLRAGIAGSDQEHARKLLQLLIDSGTLLRVGQDLFFHRESLGCLIARLHEFAGKAGGQTFIEVASFKDLAGVSRKFAIPLLEYLDREKVTRREGNRRLII